MRDTSTYNKKRATPLKWTAQYEKDDIRTAFRQFAQSFNSNIIVSNVTDKKKARTPSKLSSRFVVNI